MQSDVGYQGNEMARGRLTAITQIVPSWYDQIYYSYKDDAMLQDIIRSKLVDVAQSSRFTYIDRVVKYKGRIVIGAAGLLREELVKSTHDSYIGGHVGIQNTYRRLKAHFYWPFMKKLVHQLVQHCDICKQSKAERVPYPGLLQALSAPHVPWQDITMDFIEGLPKSKGKDTIMVIVDRFTKYGHFITLAHPFTAQEVAKSFLDHIYKFHGLPATILTDRDKIFTSLFWRELFKHLGVKLLLSTAYHPQTDGQIERVNQCLETYLRCITMHCPRKWHQWMSTTQWWYNSSFHSTINMSPFQALYGYEPPAREMVLTEATQVAVMEEWMQRMINMDQLIKGLLEGARNRMKQVAD